MSLDEYREKRDFERTPEPPPGSSSRRGNLYVIQKHDASRLHYDLRLEYDGVLLSWAVPKGPSLNPADKRLAVRTEDHPLDYANFEGVVPEGEYGGGTVMVWDTGTFGNIKDIPLAEALAAGHVEVQLHGEKLKGAWALIQMKGRGEKNWLLVKMKDDHADRETDVTESLPDSALSGRSLEEIAAGGPADA
ncbi:MAG: DNA polymerase ligase N-terminal domain-containing protein [Candidatus Brocadiaceae bacterium]|jgi:bifunctional non-homologous end joining protein LigD